MNYIENIFICLAAPLIFAVLCMRGRGQRMMVFLLCGMTACLLSSYVSTFLAAVQEADLLSASLEISPLVEEIMKALPVLFYLLIFEAGKDRAVESIMMTAVGFATFENVCYMTQNGTANILHLAIRGFGTGAMHIVCGSILAIGLLRLWHKEWLRVAGTVALLAAAITYHAIYNVMVSQEGAPALIGYIIPLCTTVLILIFRSKLYPTEKEE